MKRRNFLKLFPFAGLAAVFGMKIKTTPVVLNGPPTTFTSVKAAEGMEQFGMLMHGQPFFTKDYKDLYNACLANGSVRTSSSNSHPK